MSFSICYTAEVKFVQIMLIICLVAGVWFSTKFIVLGWRFSAAAKESRHEKYGQIVNITLQLVLDLGSSNSSKQIYMSCCYNCFLYLIISIPKQHFSSTRNV